MNWRHLLNQIRMLLESGQRSITVESDEALINLVVRNKGEHEIIFSFDALTGKPYHVSAHEVPK